MTNSKGQTFRDFLIEDGVQDEDAILDAFDLWVETLTPEQIEDLNSIIYDDESEEVIEDDEPGVQIVKDDPVKVEPKAQKEEKMTQPKAEKVKCKCCGFAKKPRRMLPSGLCKVCDLAFRDESGEIITDGDTIVVVGRQGKRGRNNVSIKHPVTGQRWTVQRKVRLES